MAPPDAILAELHHLHGEEPNPDPADGGAFAQLLGRTAAEAELLSRQERPGLPVLRMPHPSPTIQCTSPVVGDRCRAALRAAAEHLASTYRSSA